MRLNHKKQNENNKLREWAAAELHNSSIHFPGQQADKIYPPSLLFSSPFRNTCLFWGFIFYFPNCFFSEKKKLQWFPLTIMGWGNMFHSEWELQTRLLGPLGFWDAGFLHVYIFNGIYTCVSDIDEILFLLHYQWQWNGNDPLCPFASVLGESARMSWQPRVCHLGLQFGMPKCEQRVKKETKMRGK